MNQNGNDPPMLALPLAEREVVETYVRQAMPGADEAEVASQVSEVMMADALGRAIHDSRSPGAVLDMPRCVRLNSAEVIEPVPYGYDDERPDGYACSCEQIALNLIQTMKMQGAAREAGISVVRIEPKKGLN